MKWNHPSYGQRTARVGDTVHQRLKCMAAKLHTKPGKLASILLERSTPEAEWKAFEEVLSVWLLGVTRTRKRLVSHLKRLQQVLDAQRLTAAHQENILRLIGRLERQASTACRLRDLLYGIAAGRAPLDDQTVSKRVAEAHAAAMMVWQAKNSGKCFSACESQIADYLLALKILKNRD